MKMTGERRLNAPQAEVWQKLNDVEVLKRCIPGCQSLEQTSENQLKAVVALKIGPISARFTGDVTLSDLDPPNGYRISGSGKGGPAGAASGGANVRLEPDGPGTRLSYDVDARVTGKIAQLGARLIDATAANLAEKFFEKFTAEVETTTQPETTPPATSHSATTIAGLKPWQIAAGIAVLAILAYLTVGT